MFVFILISVELAILYMVYWYLFVREPKESRRISAANWGSYDSGTGGIKKFMVPEMEEMVLDPKTNHYVPLQQPRGSFLSSILHKVDDCLSELNVKA
jgi:hypothetical protein